MSYRIHQTLLLATLFLPLSPLGIGCEGVESGDPVDQTTLPIFNGSPVVDGEASAFGFVRLAITKTTGLGWCSGVVMTPNWVLTAKHCVADTIRSPGIAVPGSSITITADSVVRTATVSSTNVLLHPTADAALIRLNKAYSHEITRFMYPFTDAGLLGSKVRCFGYGPNAVTVQPNGTVILSGSGTIRSGDMRVTSTEPPPEVTLLPLLAPALPQGAISGDSGGGCFVNDAFGQMVLAGPISQGIDPFQFPESAGSLTKMVGPDAYAPWAARTVFRTTSVFGPGVSTTIASSGSWNLNVTLADISGPTLFLSNGTLTPVSLRDYVRVDGSNLFAMIANTNGTFGPLKTTPLGYAPDPDLVYFARVHSPTRYDYVEVQQDRLKIRSSLGDGTLGPLLPDVLLGTDSSWTDGHAHFVDVTGDGLDDLLYLDTNRVRVRVAQGNGTFAASWVNSNITVLGLGNSAPVQFFQDVNNDQRADVLLVNGTTLAVMLGNTNGSFQAPISAPLDIPEGLSNASDVRIADVDNDKRLDFIVVGPGSIRVKKGLATGAFGPVGAPVRFEYSSGWNQFDAGGIFDIADVGCGDGRADYLWTDPGTTWIKFGMGGVPEFGRMNIQEMTLPRSFPLDTIEPLSCAFTNIVPGRGEDRVCVTVTRIVVHPSRCVRGAAGAASQAKQGAEERSEATSEASSEETPSGKGAGPLYLGRRKVGGGLQQPSSPR